MTDLCYLPATDALRLFTARELSPVELVEAVLARAAAVEPTINAFAESFPDLALKQAREAEARYAGIGPEPRALEGIPVAVKEEAPISGHRWTQGSIPLRDEIADHTAVFVQRILDAGGIVHARTTTPEFSCAPVTWTKLWGVTRNPWNTDFSPGRLEWRVSRVAGGRHHHAGHRLGHRRVDPDPVVFLRCCRLQAAVRPGAGGRDLQPRPLLP